MSENNNTSIGTSEHIAVAISYALGWITGIIVLLVEKENETVRYHAAQSVVVFGTITVLNFILPMFLFLGLAIMSLLSLLTLILWIVFIVKALTQNPWKIDFIAPYAEKLSGSIKP